MSRPLRLEHPGAVWHVTSRGNERREVFRDDADRDRFLSILGRTVDLFRWRLHSYVLMGNHFHLLVETPEPTLSRGMRQINGLYTQAFNRRRRRSGHLFQGRFKAVLVEKEPHLLELCRYVVLNPVRAGAAPSARAWPWSNYGATAGFREAPGWLETTWTLKQFGESRRRAVERYRAFVADGKKSGYEPWEGVRWQIYLGSDEFLEDVQKRSTARPVAKGIPRRQRHPVEWDLWKAARKLAVALGTTLPEMNSRTRTLIGERRLVAWALRRHGLLTLERIGEALEVSLGQASALALAGETEAARSPAKARLLESVLS